MQLPHGTLVNSRRGPLGLKELGESIARDGLTGYLRVSVFDKSAVRESVVVYVTGKPMLAFASEGSSDRKDPDLKMLEDAIGMDNAIVEVCKLADKQVKLLQDLYRDFAIAAPVVAPAKPVPKEAPKEPPRAAPVATAARREEKPRAMAQMPEIRGKFVRAEKVASPDEYLQKHPGETGHLLFLAQRDGKVEEEHIIIIRGKIETVYNDHASGHALLEDIRNVSGHAEFYAVSEGLLTSIIGRQPKALPEAAPGAAPPGKPEKPAPGIGIPAKDLLESARPATLPARDEISRTMDEISGSMEDDLAMVRKVERDFASHVDELLCKLELSHLRTRKKR